MESAIHDINFQLAAQEERKRRHDAMAHVETFGVKIIRILFESK